MNNHQPIGRKHELSEKLQILGNYFDLFDIQHGYKEKTEVQDLLRDLARLLTNHDIATLEELEERLKDE